MSRKSPFNPFSSKSPTNPIRTHTHPFESVTKQFGGFTDPTGKKADQEKKAARAAEDLETRSQAESAAFSAQQQESRDRGAKESSEAARSRRRRGSRRSLLTGDERGVDDSGRRPVTG